MDLTICVGETCHLNGSEAVVKAVMRMLDEEGLRGRVKLRGSFCMGACSLQREVTVRCGEDVLHVEQKRAEEFARDRLLPLLRATAED